MSEVITRELTGVPGIVAVSSTRLAAANQSMGARPVAAPGISAQRSAALASGANRLVYGSYALLGGQLEAQLTIEDPSTGRMLQSFSTTTAAADVIGAATRLARQISGSATPYLTDNNQALEQYARALESTSVTAAADHLEASMAADPNFTPAYRVLGELKARQQDRAGAIRLFESALSKSGSASNAVERAQIEGELAVLRGDSAQREQAAAALAKANPLDVASWRALGETAFTRRSYRQAVEAFAKVVELEPDDVAAWNQYGYSAAYTGDLKAATSALQRYQTLRPADPNPLDSMGDVHLIHGKLKEAEDFYLQAAKKAPNFVNSADFFKAAMARLMTGDTAGADAIARQYVEARKAANDPLAPFRAAEWNWIAGRRKQAYGEMESLARSSAQGPVKELTARAYTQLAVWSLMLGDRDTAAKMSQQALSMATGATALSSFIAAFLAQPPVSGIL